MSRGKISDMSNLDEFEDLIGGATKRQDALERRNKSSKKDRVMFATNIKRSAHRALKHASADTQRTMGELVDELIERYLDELK